LDSGIVAVIDGVCYIAVCAVNVVNSQAVFCSQQHLHHIQPNH